MKSIILSKSKYLSGLQCPRYLWVVSNDQERIPDTDPVTQYIFEQGNLVGELAKKLFFDGIDVPQESFKDNIDQTKRLMKGRKPLFEAGMISGNLYSRVDILFPAGEEEWDILEVKSSTNVKDIHIEDIAFQKYCCGKAGLKIRKCFLVLINNQYIKDGEIDPEGLLNVHDITAEVEIASIGMQDRIDNMINIINRESCPEVTIGRHCRDPYECPLTECWDFLPEENIFTLYYGGNRSFDLFNSGIISIRDIPDGYKLSEKQLIQQACLANGEPFINKEAIREFLSSLHYPLYYLDFETINPVVPLFDGTRPYQHTPFQFSLHVVKDEFSQPEHFSFLASGTDDPRPALLAELRKAIGNEGSILVYSKGFEEGILRDLSTAFPEYSDWIEQVCSRLVDLLVPFRNFDYYNPAQKGSA